MTTDVVMGKVDVREAANNLPQEIDTIEDETSIDNSEETEDISDELKNEETDEL